MNILSRSLAFLIISPYVWSVNPDSTSDSEFLVGIAFGGGSYADVARDCNGRVISVTNHPYTEVAGSVHYRTSVVELGITAGRTSATREENSGHYVYGTDGAQWVSEEPGPLVYATPSIGLRSTYIGLEVGYLFPLDGKKDGSSELSPQTGMPTGMLRIGNIEKTNFSIGVARNFPLISGGGLIDVGLSSPIGSNGSRIWYGIGGYPYDGLVFSLKGEIMVTDRVALTPTLHIKGGDAFEYGWSLGGRVSF
jgi:hypothetical protein